MFHIFAFILTFCREQYISYRWSKLSLITKDQRGKVCLTRPAFTHVPLKVVCTGMSLIARRDATFPIFSGFLTFDNSQWW